MNNCELYNEDCLKTLSRIETGSIDLMLQDTPFGITQNQWDIAPEFEAMWPEWLRVGKDNCAFVFFATLPFSSDLIQSNRKMFKYDIIWEKSHSKGFLNSKKMPMRSHETILVFYKKLPTYNPQIFDKPKKNIRPVSKDRGASTNYGQYKDGDFRSIDTNKSYPASILYYESVQSNDHPTQKPIGLIRYLVLTYSNKGDTVFDGYFGSGTTAIACELECRNFIGSELNKDYFDAAVKRFENHKKQLTMF